MSTANIPSAVKGQIPKPGPWPAPPPEENKRLRDLVPGQLAAKYYDELPGGMNERVGQATEATIGPGHNLEHPTVVAFCGYLGAGKDTAAAFLKEVVEQSGTLKSLGVELQSTSFAKPIKEVLRMVYDLSENDVYGNLDRAARERPHVNLGGMSPRKAMQLIATEGFRELIDDDTWVNHWYRNEYLVADPACILYLADMRFKNEYRFLRKNCPNLITYYVHRKDKSPVQLLIDRWDRLNLTGRRSHQSEVQIDEIRRTDAKRDLCWFELTNTGTLEQFRTMCEWHFASDLMWRFCLE